MTLAQLEALEERRNVAIRHARFNVALITATLLNANRAADTDAVSPYDFLAGYEQTPEEKNREQQRRAAKREVVSVLMGMRKSTPEEIKAICNDMVRAMTANGIDNPEGLIRECFPNLEV